MVEKEQEKVWQILVTEEMKQRWGLLSEDDYPIVMAEYARLELVELKHIENKIESI